VHGRYYDNLPDAKRIYKKANRIYDPPVTCRDEPTKMRRNGKHRSLEMRKKKGANETQTREK
jgi:hypothetical protein